MWRKLPQGFHQTPPKRVLFFSVTKAMKPFGHSASISTILERTEVNWCATAYTSENFPNFCAAVLQAQKTCPRRQ